MEKLRIGVDMDGVLVDLAHHIRSLIRYDFGLDLSKEDMNSFCISDNIRDATPHGDFVIPTSVIQKYFKMNGTFGPKRKVMDKYAVEEMKKLHEDERVELYIVTSPYIGHRFCEVEKRDWIKKHLPFFPQRDVVFTAHKHLFDVDVLIDDKRENIEKFSETREYGKVIVYAHKYNKIFDNMSESLCIYRHDNWREIGMRISDILNPAIKSWDDTCFDKY